MLVLISCAGFSMIALAIYFNKSLQVHPMNLIFYSSVADATLMMNFFQSFHICNFAQFQMFASTVYFSYSTE